MYDQLDFGRSALIQMRVTTQLLEGDCTSLLENLEAQKVHMVLTDPPYFFDGLCNAWKKGDTGGKTRGAIGGLPVGMKLSREQGVALQKFMEPVAEQLFRVLKPGGFALVFSAPRLFHRMAVAFENAGFEIRDQYAWRFTKRAQFKAFSQDHFVEKMSISDSEKARIKTELGGRRTPQLRPQFESILCAQKPREGTFVENWMKHSTGLIDARQSLSGNSPTTVMTVEKAIKEKYNCHLTPKPLGICEHLIRLFSREGQLVLDPFLGSGTTCLAAKQAGRCSIGMEINPHYLEIAKQRIEEGV